VIRVLILAEPESAAASLADLIAEEDRIEIVDVNPDVLLVSGARAPVMEFAGVPAVVLNADLNNDALEPFDNRGSIRARLPNTATAAEVLAAVMAAAQGLIVLTPSQAETMLHPSHNVPATPRNIPPLVEALTPRELQVLRLIAEGMPNKEIADQLSISEHTVKFHVASVLGKLQASSRTEAVTQGIRRGLVPI
jgi:DNA-binding NarL/FixJ family response regulator